MWNWLRQLIQKKAKLIKKNNLCSTCVYWKSEEESNVPHKLNKKLRYCSIYETYTKPNHSCALYIEEKFEAKPDSIQTKEYDLNYELSIDGSHSNDTGGED